MRHARLGLFVFLLAANLAACVAAIFDLCGYQVAHWGNFRVAVSTAAIAWAVLSIPLFVVSYSMKKPATANSQAIITLAWINLIAVLGYNSLLQVALELTPD